MDLNSLNKSGIKALIAKLLGKYIFSDSETPESIKKLYHQMVGKTKYKKFVDSGKLKWLDSEEYELMEIYNALTEVDKETFVDLYFRLKNGNFFHPAMEYKIFGVFDMSMTITKNYIKNISEQMGMKERFIINYVKKIIGANILSEAKEKEMNLKSNYNERLNNLLLDRFKYTDDSKKYLVNEEGIAYKLMPNRFKISKITPIQRENNKGFKYFIVTINSKQIYLHRLIAKKFIPNEEKYKYVRAIDGNFLNLKVSNLEWVKYPATSRVLKNFSVDSNTWLGFIIKNFEDGIEITPLSEILAEIAEEQGLWPDNHNKSSTIYSTIEKYSQTNDIFPIFNIYKGERNIVLINSKVYNEFKEKEGKNEAK